jgi:hypothetical protein
MINSQLELMAEQMTEDEITKKIDEYQKACEIDREHMELDDSIYWWNELDMNTRMFINYERILKIKQNQM